MPNLTALARELQNKQANAAQTFAGQWFERTLGKSLSNSIIRNANSCFIDDSAIRRIDIPEQFLLADAICA